MTTPMCRNAFEALAAANGGPHCFWCGRHLTPKGANRDHVCPVSQGGTRVVLSCISCNSLRGLTNSWRAQLERHGHISNISRKAIDVLRTWEKRYLEVDLPIRVRHTFLAEIRAIRAWLFEPVKV